MARAKKDLLGIEGRVGGLTKYTRNGKEYWRVSENRKNPHRPSLKQLAVRERQSHNNALWRALSATGQVYIERGSNTVYSHFMSLNTESPIPYLEKRHYHSWNALLLPNMVLSDGPLRTINYQLGEVTIPSASGDSHSMTPALMTDLTMKEAKKGTLLLYVLQQRVNSQQGWPDQFQLDIKVETIEPDMFIVLPPTLLTPYQSKEGCLALVGERFADPMLGFGLVQVINGKASSQRVVTHCTYYEKYTTEEAIQAAAKSYTDRK